MTDRPLNGFGVVATITDAGGRAVTHAGSAAGESVAQDLITLCEKQFGAVDAVVN